MELAELRKSAARWMADDPDPDTREELRALLAQPDPAATDLADRFAGPLEFGTAGLRGVLGAGPNRMNLAVVMRATWGLAQELLASVPAAAMRGVVVGGDARRMSRQFAEHTAAVLAAAGIRVVLFRTPVPTPLVGFAVKHLGAAAGVMVTASHNPAEYNGFKIYWENAAQIIAPVDGRIASAMARAPAASEVVHKALNDLQARARVTDAPPALERAYLDAIRALAVHPTGGDRSLRIVYTPMHGVGDSLARRALAESGFTDVTSVPEQQRPDGAFPTVAFPNPEERGAMDLAFALAKKTGAHLVIANDPDADRLAVAIPEGDAYRQLTGNQLGVLLGHYLLTEKRSGSAEGPRRVVLASIVSSPLLGRIAASLGVRYEETLTGFKWIANRAIELEREPDPWQLVLGYEEALGYCVGDAVHDKDGISGALVAAEVVAVLRERGRSVRDELDAIARRWGVYTSSQVNVMRKGVSGLASLRAMMARLRGSPPRRIGEDEVVAVSDYEARTRTEVRTRGVGPLSLPKSNVLTFDLASGSRVIARPSGTEPKVKFYFDVRQEVAESETVAAATERASASMRRLAEAFVALVET
jgi:phosphomannomutase